VAQPLLRRGRERGDHLRVPACRVWFRQVTRHRPPYPVLSHPARRATAALPPLRVTLRCTGPPSPFFLAHPLLRSAMYNVFRIVGSGALAFVTNRDGNTGDHHAAAPLRFMTGAQHAADVAARRAGLQRRPESPPTSSPLPAARHFLNPMFASTAAPGTATCSRLPHSPYGVAPGGSQSPQMAAAAPLVGGRDAASGCIAGVAGVAQSSAAGNGSVQPSGAAVGAATSADPAEWACSQVYTAVAVPPGLADVRSFARRGPVDDRDNDEDNGYLQEGGNEYTPRAGTGTTFSCPMAGSTSTMPLNKKRRGRAGTRCAPPTPTVPRRGGPPGGSGMRLGSPYQSAGGAASGAMSGVAGNGTSPSPTAGGGRSIAHPAAAVGASPRTRRASGGSSGATPPPRPACVAAAEAASGSGTTGVTTAAQIAEVMRTSSTGFSGVRREITAQRKEVAIMNSQIRAVTKKLDDVAVLADRLTASLFYQRRAIINMAGDVTSVLTWTAAESSAAMASGAGPAVHGVPDADGNARNTSVTTPEGEVQEAQWILELKVCCFCTASVW